MLEPLHLVIVALLAVACLSADVALGIEGSKYDISEHGAVAGGNIVNTVAIQAAIDELASKGGGTLIIPKGEFLCGSLFLKSGVNIELLEGAVLKGSPDIDDYPVLPTRFEGHFHDHRMALINAEKIDHLRITGPGVIDGSGAAFWQFRHRLGRPRLVFVRDSSDVDVHGVTFMNSASWNLHLYNCNDATVEACRFEISRAGEGPATDGTDIDSCQNITVRGCYYAVNDDCICLKGNRYDGLDQKPASPPVSNIHIIDCTFVRGMGALSLGTEATSIHDVEFEHSKVSGSMPMLRVKLRPDTAGQDYENINVHDIALDGSGKIFSFELTHGTKGGQKAPGAIIRNIAVYQINGSFGAIGTIAANDTTAISDISLKDFNVKVADATLFAAGVKNFTAENVTVNGTPMGAATLTEKPAGNPHGNLTGNLPATLPTKLPASLPAKLNGKP